jgi:glutathione peroxidase
MIYRSILKKVSLFVALVATSGVLFAQKSDKVTDRGMMAHDQQVKSFYDFKVKTLADKDFSLDQLKGKRVLIVNTASECGSTPQYAQVQELYAQYADAGFVIVGFPSNDFGGQEPGSSTEIASFCQKNYGVTFPMMAKTRVKGAQIDPLFSWLTQKSLNGVSDAEITWNFSKFLIDENGNWIAAFPMKVEPLDDRIVMFAAGQKW